MKASELMLNDLVEYDYNVCKIVATNAYRDCVELIDIDDEDKEVVGKYAKHLKPIPLTPEILELNGFKYGYTSNEEDITSGVGVPIDIPQGWVLDEGDGSVKIIFPNEYDGGLLSIYDQCYNRDMQFGWTDILYVHELQRALRCCGLFDLADNFKIK